MCESAILVIDMQNDFVSEESRCCVKNAAATIPAIARLLEEGRRRGVPVIYVARTHRADGSDAEAFRRHLFDISSGSGVCVEGSRGADIVDKIKPTDKDYIVRKTRFDAFFATDLEVLLRGLDVRTVYIAGTQYPNCIRSTAVGAIERGYEVVVVTDCCSAATREVEEANIYDLRNMGIRCKPSTELF